MKWRIELTRKPTAQQPGQAGRRHAIEVTARTAPEARQLAETEALRRGIQLRAFDMQAPRSI